jgi:hypothetical protein
VTYPNIFQALAKRPLRALGRTRNNRRSQTGDLGRRQLLRVCEEDGDELRCGREREACFDRILGDVRGKILFELGGEDVVVDRVSDGASDCADGERHGCGSGDERVGTDEHSDCGCGDEYASHTESCEGSECDDEFFVLGCHDGERARKAGHDEHSKQEDFSSAVGKGRQRSIERDSPDGGCESGTDTSDSDLDWNGVVDVGEGDGEEVEDLWRLVLGLKEKYRASLR